MTHANAVPIDDMRGQLLTLDQVHDRLAATEPLSEVTFDTDHAQIRYESGWAAVKDPTELTSAYLLLPGGTEYQFTKQGALELGAVCHMPRGLQEKTPPDVLGPFINWWLEHGEDIPEDLKALVNDDRVQAITRSTVSPFSNLRMLDTMLAGIERKYGEGEVLVDYKFHHTLEATALRLIIPGFRRDITGTGVPDDTWSIGLDYANSLVGLRQLKLRGYMFRWWCTNGCTDTLQTTGNFSRRGNSEEDALAWAADTVDSVLGGLEGALDNVQSLTDQQVPGDVRDILEGLFSEYSVNQGDRQRVIEDMAEDDQMTSYSLMNAITRAANQPGLDYRSVDRLLNTGGHYVRSHGQRCNLGRMHRIHDDWSADPVPGEVVDE